MSDYIKIPTFPKHDLLRGVEAISPYPRVDSQQPRQEGSSQQQSDTAEKKDGLARRRFLSLRRLIDELKESAQITKLDFGTADAELRNLGLAIVEEELIDQLLQLKIPLQSIEQLLQQINQNLPVSTLAAVAGSAVKNRACSRSQWLGCWNTI